MADDVLRFGKIEILEWLRPGEMKTGRDLFDEVEPMGIASTPAIRAQYRQVWTRAEFLAALREIENEFRATAMLPLLHIETHGSIGGIGVSEQEGIAFAELMEELIPLNRMSGLHLIVVLAACEGIWGMKMLQPARGAAAFRALIGPEHEILPEQLAKGCQTFYRGLFSRAGDGNEAFRAMNDAVDVTKPTFFAISAEGALKMVFRGYLQELCAPGEIERRVDAMEAKALQQRRDDGLPDMFSKDKQWARRLLRDSLVNHRAHFDRIRREFFFIDQVPENDQRFDVKFEDCQPSPDGPVQT
jgi:hypothetical protein